MLQKDLINSYKYIQTCGMVVCLKRGYINLAFSVISERRALNKYNDLVCAIERMDVV